MNSLWMTDGYKISHYLMYPRNIEYVYSNFTPRSNDYAPFGNNSHILNFGQTAVIKYIIDHFNNNFFNKTLEYATLETQKVFSQYVSTEYDIKHFVELHQLGYLPLIIKSLPEGTESHTKIPVLTIMNTDKRFFWLTNYLETAISNMLWQMITSATTALIYKRIGIKWITKTDQNNIDNIKYMFHDFSYRGLTSTESAIFNGMAHASVFHGSDTLPAIYGIQKYYNSSSVCPIASVAASEHSQMTAGGIEGEFDVISDLMDRFPAGILSIVSDSYDLWNVLTVYLPQLKSKIMARDGKLVIRPDSSKTTPADIICGSPLSDDINESRGVVQILYEIFGGFTNDQGYKILDSHIGCIYGDSISTEMANDIFERLACKGFASTNIVFGIGSATYQWKTRDTWGIACKCTAQKINDKWVSIHKNPSTDSGTKKSAKGLLSVIKVNDRYILKDDCTPEEESCGELKTIYKDGQIIKENTDDFATIRQKISLLS